MSQPRVFERGCLCGRLRYRAPDRIDVSPASLVEPAAIEPQYHIRTESRIPWLEIDDGLPRYADAGPDAPTS